jgi:hypothetical protein
MRKRESLVTGPSQRRMNPLKYEINLAVEVQKAFCRFWIGATARQSLVDALMAFGEATSTRIHHFTEIEQGIYVASAKANEMKRRGDPAGTDARASLLRTLYLIRYELIKDEPERDEWPDLIDDGETP